MHVANFSKSEIFFIGIKMWLKIVPFVNSDFQFSISRSSQKNLLFSE